ncbi:MAG: peptidylprolyl isomerase [Candidatus Sedimenticola endophacoides]|uniref:Peptidyl-prolyl cis-trans isomerase n=1 Tax=Candidatus Sedimenticola endophacoides TaxID=2548426 RepID=A0A657PQM6_9GAMM|nr:MAG: peptidylprolyl isomerase [Candidatus Sedimenticola endophacoides]OQX34743.1 MAG: peptidylprolyl isomerase [Candidatus Sedimenticola endophacoides]OQX34957.1 MAG: peptidylprolyl isomerase [Candidatus Sedimenticola endophacoides]OQX38825.1 MAG: peptidylprolyl isomerase [Candidatus Sedimenticola endophacoides]OQX40019.1 MAG: peptidylprolyl isomerase [Candidatus Sedimenticola endophacoides]
MTQAKMGDTVKVHYTGTFDDGTQFDSSQGSEPLEVTLGQGQVIPGFEAALEGMTAGETKSVHIPAEMAYGEYSPEMVQEVERTAIPEEIELSLGIQLQAHAPDGTPFMLVVTGLNDETVTLDANHPLAGKALNFALEMVAINA